MKLTKNHYHLKEMYAVIGKNGGMNALYPVKHWAKKSHRFYDGKTIKKVQVLVGNDELNELNEKSPGTSSVTREEIMFALADHIKEIYEVLFSGHIADKEWVSHQLSILKITRNRIEDLENEKTQ